MGDHTIALYSDNIGWLTVVAGIVERDPLYDLSAVLGILPAKPVSGAAQLDETLHIGGEHTSNLGLHNSSVWLVPAIVLAITFRKVGKRDTFSLYSDADERE